GQENADGMVVTPAALSTWWGSLISEKLDASGMKYMRNRYYNPQTGQFTQQDPMGLAGGLNLYGFAAGDPVNFSDPFGLCPVCLVVLVEGGEAAWDVYSAYRGAKVFSNLLAQLTPGLISHLETKSHTTGRTTNGPRIRVDWEEPTSSGDPGNVHIQGEGPDKEYFPKRKVTDPDDPNQLPKALQNNDELKRLIRRALDQLEKFREQNSHAQN
ncbi:MAG: RHS repeat-associated core domain-containing protein, partial [Gemmatimonadaceae bacterium]